MQQALLVIAGMCVFSTASALFMFPAMYPYYQKALVVYGFEKADGVGRAYDLVIQGFIRFSSITFFPVIFAVTTIYLLVSQQDTAWPQNIIAYMDHTILFCTPKVMLWFYALSTLCGCGKNLVNATTLMKALKMFRIYDRVLMLPCT